MARFMLDTDKMQENADNLNNADVQVKEAAPAPSQIAPPPQRRGAHSHPEPEPVQEENQYAHAFAAWDLLPPQVIIRRVTRK